MLRKGKTVYSPLPPTCCCSGPSVGADSDSLRSSVRRLGRIRGCESIDLISAPRATTAVAGEPFVEARRNRYQRTRLDELYKLHWSELLEEAVLRSEAKNAANPGVFACRAVVGRDVDNPFAGQDGFVRAQVRSAQVRKFQSRQTIDRSEN